jgi:hypothetical protein
MDSIQSPKLNENKISCSNCEKKISKGQEYHFNKKVLCENCFISLRTPLTRKTHWQYIGSIKAEYLIPSSKNVEAD